MAGAVSLLLHGAVLGAFCFVEFSHPKAEASIRAVPSANVSTVSRLLREVRVVGKPKVRRAGDRSVSGAILAPIEEVFSVDSVFEDVNSVLSREPLKPFSWPDEVLLSERVEFFGSRALERKVFYLVDCSSSMEGVFERVQSELTKSIESLHPDQFFYVIFFGGGALREFSGGAMLRASTQSKQAAGQFIESIEPSGSANSIAALERVLGVRDAGSGQSRVIYFLTDGFDLGGDVTGAFRERLEWVLLKLGAGSRVNPIGFWPRGGDVKLLERMAEITGGEFLCPGQSPGGTKNGFGSGGDSILEETAVEDE